ncbi:MAG: hypothetical protein IJ323_00685 [Clostridia bacterium]|nr:hypothetical protein [Clostridia bacterium]
MTFLKKHALKLFIILLVLVILFLLWYHLFPVKIPFDHAMYSEKGEEVKLEGELQYYRSFFANGGKTYGEVTFNGVRYGLPAGGPYMFDLYDLDVQAIILQRDRITINFQNKEYKDFFITKSPYPGGNSENYFLTKPEIDTEEDLAVMKKVEKPWYSVVLDDIENLPNVVVIDGEDIEALLN